MKIVDKLKIVVFISCFSNKQDTLVDEVIEICNNFNNAHNLKGMLITNGEDILQCIQGGQEIVDNLVDRIKRDNRHRQMNIVYDKCIQDEIFTDWKCVMRDDIPNILTCLGLCKNVITLLYNFTNNLI